MFSTFCEGIIPYLTLLDVLINMGDEARNIVQNIGGKVPLYNAFY